MRSKAVMSSNLGLGFRVQGLGFYTLEFRALGFFLGFSRASYTRASVKNLKKKRVLPTLSLTSISDTCFRLLRKYPNSFKYLESFSAQKAYLGPTYSLHCSSF